MKIGDNQPKFIVINKRANSLYSLISDGKYRSTSLGRETWKSLIGSEASLQDNCNREGFNTKSDREKDSKARIGILFNNENECKSCDSRIGFGTGGYPDDSNTCGNEALFAHEADNGDKHIKAMGYILVQWTQNNTEETYVCQSFLIVTITCHVFSYIGKLAHTSLLSDMSCSLYANLKHALR